MPRTPVGKVLVTFHRWYDLAAEHEYAMIKKDHGQMNDDLPGVCQNDFLSILYGMKISLGDSSRDQTSSPNVAGHLTP